MDSPIYALLSIGPMALLAALLSVPLYYLAYRYAPEPKQRVSVVRYALVALGMGGAGYVVGTMSGIAVACLPPDAGNLCGLVGLFGAGPLFAAVAIVVYARRWVKRARRVPEPRVGG